MLLLKRWVFQKKTVGYSVVKVSGKYLAITREPNIINALNGKVAGITINQTASGSAESNRVTLRWNVSISGNNEVLYVVDRIPFDDSSFTTSGTDNQSGSR